MADPITIGQRQKTKPGNPNVAPGFWVILGLLTFMLVFFLPVWPFSTHWGYYPSVGIGFVMLFFVTYLLMGAFLGRKPTNTSA